MTICNLEEYENDDFTRVDCLTEKHAVEFDFANKWAESIGQAEHYAHKTGKRGKVVLILEEPKKEKIYYKRVKELGKIHNFDVEYVTPKRDIPKLLKYCVISMITDGANAKLGTIFTPYEFYYAWKKINEQERECDGISSLITLLRGALSTERITKIIRDEI